MNDELWGPDHPHFHDTAEDCWGDGVWADFEYWRKAAYWTIEESTALSFGMEPRVVNVSSVAGIDHPFATSFTERLNLVRRAAEVGHLSDRPNPTDVMRWLHSNGFDVPPELSVAKTPSRELDTRSRNTLLRMILGMAKDKYHYKLATDRQRAVVAITGALERQGTPVGEDNVRKWLSLAEEEFGAEDG